MNKPSILSFTPLHYGADYLPYAIAALYPFCDELLIAYTKEPSYGHRSKAACPESQGQLRDAAYSLVGDGAKIRWIEGQWNTEGEHRSEATLHARKHGFDVVLSADSDEIWPKESVQCVLDAYAKDELRWSRYRLPFVHFWRSFNHVCRDGQRPVRVQVLRNNRAGENDFPLPSPILHFGYAIRDQIMEAKWEVHGHKSELRPEWFKDVWYNSLRCDDLHPVSRNFWNAEDFDKTTLPELLKSHPFYNLDRIQ